MKDYDEIYNGPRRHKPIAIDPSQGFGNDLDQAFALGRTLYAEGRSSSHLSAIGKKKSRAWLASLRKGYAWAKKRDGEPVRHGAKRVHT